MKTTLKKTFDFANRFIQSDYFILLCAVVVLIGWATDVWAPLLAVLALLAILPIFFAKGTKQMLCVIMMFTLIIRSNRHRLDDYVWLLFLLVVLLVGALVNLIRFRRPLSALSPKRIKGFQNLEKQSAVQ